MALFLRPNCSLRRLSRPDYPYQVLAFTLLRGTLESLVFPMGKDGVTGRESFRGRVRSSILPESRSSRLENH